MRYFVLYILLSTSVLSQKNIQPICSIGIGNTLFNNWISFNGLASGGIRVNDRFKFEAELGYITSSFKSTGFERMYFITGGLSIGCRVLNKKFSPYVQLETGTQLLSNGKDELIRSNFSFTKKEHESTIGKFNRFGPYLNINIGASYLKKSMEIFITGGYRINQYSYHYYFYSNDYEYLDKVLTKKYIKGINVNLGVSYTFQRKKLK